MRSLKPELADASVDFLLNEAVESLLDRFLDITHTFPVAVDLGAHTGQLAKRLQNSNHVGKVISAEANPDLLAQCPSESIPFNEDHLPFDDNSIDLVISCLSLHWVNDLPKLLEESQRILKPGGLFLATLPGEDTLHELRESFARAELECDGGISPRVAPMVTIKDAARLLQAAGFENPIADRDRLTVDYPHPLKLMHDLRAMGETNPMFNRRKTPLRRQTLMQMMETYRSLHTNSEGRFLASFDLITMTAWKPETTINNGPDK